MPARRRATAWILAAAAFVVVHEAPPVGAADGAATASFLAITPVRAADTRTQPCTCTRIDEHTVRVDVGDLAVAGAEAVAAAVTVTATNTAGNGFLAAYPAGTTRPDTSILNMRAGRDSSNSAIVLLHGGAIDVYVQTAADVIVDVTGLFVAAGTATAGRFQPLAPQRLLDTRQSQPGGLAAGGAVRVALPASIAVDASAVVVNVTSVAAPGPGYIGAYAAGSAPSATSIANPDGSGAPLAASAIVPVSAAGLTVTTSAGGHVVVDVTGWFTGPSAPLASDGLFVPVAPARLLDTRADHPRLWAGGTRELPVPESAAALVSNITLAAPDDPGFVTAYPAGTERPGTSSINATARDAVAANLAITPLSTRGAAYFSSAGTDLVVDVAGYFTGAALAATMLPLPNAPPNPRVVLIGDSTLGALNVVPSSQSALRGFVPVVDAEPCRRLVRPSCQSAYTLRTPNTAVEAIAATPGPLDMVVIRGGYNDGSVGFQAAVDAVVRAARARGVRWVVWLTYSEGTGNQLTTYTRHNATLVQMAAGGAYPELVVADWRTYAAGQSSWYASDRVHLARNGAWATADYVSRWVAHIVRRACPLPWQVGGITDDPCPSPDAVALATMSSPDLQRLYGL